MKAGDTTSADAFATSSAQEWAAEYHGGGIPSSVREEPSASVVRFIEQLQDQGVASGCAIDVGCGGGRNSLFLASQGYQVTAIDFVLSAIEDLKARARSLGVGLNARCHDVRRRWPCPAGSQRIAIDAFCFKHQIHPDDVGAYIRNVTEALAPGAHLMLSFAGKEDGYYSRFPTCRQHGIGITIADPGNGILSRLYDPEEVVRSFDSFELVDCATKRNVNEMHGAHYPRVTHVLHLRKAQ